MEKAFLNKQSCGNLFVQTLYKTLHFHVWITLGLYYLLLFLYSLKLCNFLRERQHVMGELEREEHVLSAYWMKWSAGEEQDMSRGMKRESNDSENNMIRWLTFRHY